MFLQVRPTFRSGSIAPCAGVRQVASCLQALLCLGRLAGLAGVPGTLRAPVAEHPALAEGCRVPQPLTAANSLRSVSWHITKHGINN